MPYDKHLKIEAEKKLRDASWPCHECGENMPLEYEENDEDEVGYSIIG
ncbi:MAG: hypothetical protein ACI9JM_003347, partial [Halioglobus sp.]